MERCQNTGGSMKPHSDLSWREFRFASTENPVKAAMNFIGGNGRFRISPVERLKPITKQAARPNSLSRTYGLGRQPPHTDGAHLEDPPAFILLWSAATDLGQTPTVLRDYAPQYLDKTFFEEFSNSIWSVRINSRSFFYTRPIFSNGREIKWDSGCFVKCVTGDFERRDVDAQMETLPAVEYFWRERYALLINNRRVLHGRGAVAHPQAMSRELFRVSFYGG